MRYILARTEKRVTSWLSPSSTTTRKVSEGGTHDRRVNALTLLQLGLFLILSPLGRFPTALLLLVLIVGQGITLSVLVFVALLLRLVLGVALGRAKRLGRLVALKDFAGFAKVYARP
jgi:hypothetical protein